MLEDPPGVRTAGRGGADDVVGTVLGALMAFCGVGGAPGAPVRRPAPRHRHHRTSSSHGMVWRARRIAAVAGNALGSAFPQSVARDGWPEVGRGVARARARQRARRCDVVCRRERDVRHTVGGIAAGPDRTHGPARVRGRLRGALGELPRRLPPASSSRPLRSLARLAARHVRLRAGDGQRHDLHAINRQRTPEPVLRRRRCVFDV